MPARRRSAAAHVTAPVEPGLRLHAEGERYGTLLKERERLLRSIRSKKQKLEQALETSHQARESVLAQLGPLLELHDTTTAQIGALFDELLAPGRLGSRAAKLVAKVRRTMAALGFLGFLEEALEPDEDEESEWPPSSGEGPWPEQSDDEPASAHAQREVGSAEQRGQGKDQESLRAVFKRLVVASHPDRAANEADRERRTAALKLATQAYEQGDLARLLELEAAWQRDQSLPLTGTAEARCRELELVIRELRAQSSQLQRELRAARASATLTLESEPILEALTEAQHDVEQLAAIRDFIARFRDGKISLAEFVAGPAPLHTEEDLEEAIREFMSEQAGNAAQPPKRRPAKAAPKRRKQG